MQKIIILSFIFLVLGCDNEKMPEFTKIDKLRIIALEASAPEVNPGDTITITPWVSDINETVALTDSVTVCLDPGIAFGASPSCSAAPGNFDIRLNQTVVITGSNFTGSASTFNVTIPADTVIFANRTDQEKWNGVNYLIHYRLKNSSGTEIESIRRIVVTDPAKTPKNLNPSLTTIFSDGTPMVAFPGSGAKVNLSTDITAASQESYQSKNSDGTLVTETEQVSITWMITDGETKRARSDIGATNEFTAPSSVPATRKAHIFAVGRDNRGGVKVIKVEF